MAECVWKLRLGQQKLRTAGSGLQLAGGVFGWQEHVTDPHTFCYSMSVQKAVQQEFRFSVEELKL